MSPRTPDAPMARRRLTRSRLLFPWILVVAFCLQAVGLLVDDSGSAWPLATATTSLVIVLAGGAYSFRNWLRYQEFAPEYHGSYLARLHQVAEAAELPVGVVVAAQIGAPLFILAWAGLQLAKGFGALD